MTDVETIDTSLTIRRTFDASRELVFRAFTDPEELEQWYAPGDTTPDVRALEPEPEGALSVSFLHGDDRTDIEGTYVDVIENERIVHTWNYPGEEESLVTYEFLDIDEGTEVVLTHEHIGPYEDLSARENVDGYVKGWSSALDTLDAVLAGEGKER